MKIILWKKIPTSSFCRRNDEKKALSYDLRIGKAVDKFHNLPQTIEDIVIQEGAWSQRIKDGSDWFELEGKVNGASGVFQVGISPDNILFHRNFVPN